MPDPETARQTRPEGFISDDLWGQLCDQFIAMNESGSDGKSKSQRCREARKSIATEHHWDRTSITGWSHKHVQKFGKVPTVATKFRKGYMSIDALKESEPLPVDGSDSEIGGGDRERQVDQRVKTELRAIAANLDRVYQECMNDGSDESTANTIACERVLGKTKRLRLGCSSSKKRARSNLSSVASDEEIAVLKEDNQTLKDEMNQMQSTMKAMVEYFRAQGVEFHPQKPPDDGN